MNTFTKSCDSLLILLKNIKGSIPSGYFLLIWWETIMLILPAMNLEAPPVDDVICFPENYLNRLP